MPQSLKISSPGYVLVRGKTRRLSIPILWSDASWSSICRLLCIGNGFKIYFAVTFWKKNSCIIMIFNVLYLMTCRLSGWQTAISCPYNTVVAQVLSPSRICDIVKLHVGAHATMNLWHLKNMKSHFVWFVHAMFNVLR